MYIYNTDTYIYNLYYLHKKWKCSGPELGRNMSSACPQTILLLQASLSSIKSSAFSTSLLE